MIQRGFQDQLARRASAAKIELPPALGEQLEAYYRLLARWNARINLTALALDPITDEAVDRLLIEPLTAAHIVLTESPLWIDVGSGGGSPAIPLKLAKPGARLTMVESRERKAAFLREAVRALSIDNASVEGGRLETVAADARLVGAADLITVRAVKLDPTLITAIRILLRVGGRALFFGAKRPELQALRGFEMPEAIVASSDAQDSGFIVLNRVGI